MAGGRCRWIAVGWGLLLTSCSGVLQHRLPERAAFHEAEATAESWRVGFGRADITPDPDSHLYLAGFSLNRPAEGNASTLEVRAMVVEGGGQKIAIVGLDSLGLMLPDVDWIKRGLDGFDPQHVFVCASHVHSAPDLVGIWGFYLASSGRDESYLAQVAAGVRDAVRAADAAVAPATLHRGVARLPDEGMIRNSNRAGVFDRDLTVIEARGTDGAPLGSLIHMACHPEVLNRRLALVSSDFVGPLRDGWEAAGRGTAVFCNGALGALVSPRWDPRDQDGAETFGARCVELALGAVQAASPCAGDALRVHRRDLYLPLTSPYLNLGNAAGAIARPIYEHHLRTTVGYLEFGGVALAAVPGEMEPTLAERLEQATGREDLLVLGLCDDEVGYLMSEVDARDPLFDYELGMSPGPEAGERVVGAIAALVR